MKLIQTHKSHLYLARRVRDEGAGGLAGPPLRKQSLPRKPGLLRDQGNRTEGEPTRVGWLSPTTEAEQDPAPPLFFWHHKDLVTPLLDPPFCHKPYQAAPRLGPSGGRQIWPFRSCPTSKGFRDMASQLGRSSWNPRRWEGLSGRGGAHRPWQRWARWELCQTPVQSRKAVGRGGWA